MENKKISTNRPANTKVTAGRQKKEQIVAKLSEKIEKAKGIVFTNYQGLTHKQLEGLKKSLKSLDAELVVAKNTLLKLSLKNMKYDDSNLKNPTATLLLYEDVVLPLKQLAKSIKELGLPTIKFGIVGNEALTGDQLLKLASLPSREVLIAQVLSGLKSPIFGLHRALNWNLQKLVMTLSAIQQSKS